MKDKRLTVPVMGASSLLTIFSVLCLVVFALLSISTVQSQRSLSDASYGAVEGYYAADAEAQALLARLRGGEIPEGVIVQEDRYCYSCPISDTQVLEVEVQLEGADYTIVRWQAVSNADWDSEDRLQVWDGGAGPG